MKTCAACKRELPFSEFHKKGDRLAGRCKPCTKAYRAENYKQWTPEKKAKLIAKNKQQAIEMTAFMRSLKDAPCVDCGGRFHFSAMDFDHIGTDKLMNVSRMVDRGSKRMILEEVAKCELVCANCHRVRTYMRRVA